MDGGHQTFNDAELVVDDLGERSQAVGRTRSVGDDFVLGLVRIQIDAANEHGGVSGGSGDDDLLGAALQVGGGPEDNCQEVSQTRRGGIYFSVVVKTPVDSTM